MTLRLTKAEKFVFTRLYEAYGQDKNIDLQESGYMFEAAPVTRRIALLSGLAAATLTDDGEARSVLAEPYLEYGPSKLRRSMGAADKRVLAETLAAVEDGTGIDFGEAERIVDLAPDNSSLAQMIRKFAAEYLAEDGEVYSVLIPDSEL